LKILITGASGFLGSALAHRFSLTKNKVALLVRKNSNLSRLKDPARFEIAFCDTDNEVQQYILSISPDIVINTACCYGRGAENPMQMVNSNINFGLNILAALDRIDKNTTFINAGSALVKDINMYSLTKAQFEEIACLVAGDSNPKIQLINIKMQHIYGPGDDESKFITHIFHACRNNTLTIPMKAGEQRRDFIFIDDVVEAYVRILENINILGRSEYIELGSGTSLPLRDVAESIHEFTNSRSKLIFGQIPYRKKEQMLLRADIRTLTKLGWAPKFDIKSGIMKMIEMEES
jgi:nucleoside-diphosphate-sugar epimerase